MLEHVCGNEETLASLNQAMAGGKLPHAVLLCAPDGCGRNFAARCLAADWLFPKGGPGADAVLRGESSEVLTVQGEGKSGQIPVARIRQVRSDVFLSSLSAAGRVVYIRDAHNMAAPAYNALLKVLEEPPTDALFLLTAQSAGAMPATITSRCARYSLAPLGRAVCSDMLRQKCPEADAATCALLAAVYDGRPGLGLAALVDAGRMAVLRDALKIAKAAAARDEYALLCAFAKYEGRADGEREKRDQLLFDLVCALDAALRQEQAPGLAQMPPDAAALLLPPVTDAQGALRGNAAPKIAFTALVVNIAQAGL